MPNLESLKHTILQLAPEDFEELARWLADAQEQRAGSHVAEAAVPYEYGPQPPMSFQQYLEWEKRQSIRYELVAGKVFAMAGASASHNRISGNVFHALRNALEGQPCEPFMSDMKLKVERAESTECFYPDVMIICDSKDNATAYREHPTVIFEVLSPDTRRTDEREKAIVYRSIPSVQIYALVEQTRPLITTLRPVEGGWMREVLEGMTAVLKLEPFGIEILFEKIYQRVF